MSAPAIVTLDSISESVDYGVTASAASSNVGPKFLRITDIQNGQVDWNQVPWCECSQREAEGSRLAGGDIVFARTGATTGKSFLIRECPEDAVFASYLIRVRLGKSALPSFVAHYFQTAEYWAQISSNVRGVAQPGVNATTLKSLRVPLPPLEEQRRISAILDQAETLRTQRRTALALLDNLTQSLFLDMFGDPVANPKGWQARKLQDVVKQDTIVTYGIVQAGEEFPGGIPYIRTGDIVDGSIRLSGLRHTDPEIAAKFARSRVEENEIVMSIRATVGTTALVPVELSGANLTQGTARIAPGADVHFQYLLYFLRSDATQQWIERQVKGATFREITLGRLRELPVLVPPLHLQQTFATRIASIEALKATHRRALAALDALFAALQQRAFAGQL